MSPETWGATTEPVEQRDDDTPSHSQLSSGGGCGTTLMLALVIMLLALLCAACDDTSCQVTGTFTDSKGIERVVCIDQADGALLTIPKVQVPGPVKAGDTITGSVIYSK
jgi:hypothetical protein